MIFENLKLLVLPAFLFASIGSIAQPTDLYYGGKRQLLTTEVFLVIDSTRCIAEVFQPLKGQVVKLITDTLMRASQRKTIFEGHLLKVTKDSQLCVEELSKDGAFGFGRIRVENQPEQWGKYNEYKNRAYLFEDRDRCVTLLKERLGSTPRIYSEFDRLNREYSVLELAKKLQYSEFLAAYAQIRKKILDTILSSHQ